MNVCMKMSDDGLALLMEREGVRHEAYRDSVGVWTIGVGHTGPEVVPGLVWTDEQVAAALHADLAWVEAAINNNVQPDLEQNQFDALASFVFNVGNGAWLNSTMLRLLNEGASIDTVAAQFDRWHIPASIIPRRNGEREQFKGTAFQARIP